MLTNNLIFCRNYLFEGFLSSILHLWKGQSLSDTRVQKVSPCLKGIKSLWYNLCCRAFLALRPHSCSVITPSLSCFTRSFVGLSLQSTLQFIMYTQIPVTEYASRGFDLRYSITPGRLFLEIYIILQ